MQVSIRDHEALLAVSPTALSAYARAAGWSRGGTYRANSDIYDGEELPEILVPRTERLGDYASVVARLIQTFSKVVGQDELTIYRSLVVANRDVIRLRAGESVEGSLSLNDGVNLIEGARNLIFSVACSLDIPKPVYRTSTNRDAMELLQSVRLGTTDQSDVTVTLLTPPMPTSSEDQDDEYPPTARRLTRRLPDVLSAARLAIAQVADGDGNAFHEAVKRGVSANLCEALVQIVEPFPWLDISISWAWSCPVEPPQTTMRFRQTDTELLREGARSLRQHAPHPDISLTGFVHLLKRGHENIDRTIRLWTHIEGQRRTIEVELEKSDYELAMEAHRERMPVGLTGDLDHVRQRWRLLNPQLDYVLRDDCPDSKDVETGS